jgi:hypothetical protein
MPRPIRLNAFDMNCVAHQSPGLWRHPDDHAADYRKLSYWTDLAQLLERGPGTFIDVVEHLSRSCSAAASRSCPPLRQTESKRGKDI